MMRFLAKIHSAQLAKKLQKMGIHQPATIEIRAIFVAVS
jgi:hypothetical protein